jgi:NADH:ubiquinone reductase (H+-translocating)
LVDLRDCWSRTHRGRTCRRFGRDISSSAQSRLSPNPITACTNRADEAAPRVLPGMSEESSSNAERQLKRMGVELMLNTIVTDVDDAGATLGQGHVASHTVIWAAGVAASPLRRSLGAPTDKAGRVRVNQDLSVPKAPDVFVIGDLAAITSEGKPVPGVAPAAAQEGHHAARNVIRVIRVIRGEGVKPFRYRDKGTLASIGRGAAVADLGRIGLSGPLAWITWLGVHILYLIGFRNRFIVMAEWAWLYLWNERGARLITGDVEPLLKRGRRESQQIGPSQEITRERITIEGNSATY